MPMALESFDLRGYDLVISSESGPAKGVITGSSTRHVCYCHTPMRYLWDLYPAYLHEWTRSRLKRALIAPLANYLRLWDFAAAARVDEFVANSENVRQADLENLPARCPQVIHPPVAVGDFPPRARRRLLSDRQRTGAIQADRSGRAHVFEERTQAAHRRRRTGIFAAAPDRRAEHRILRPRLRR